MTQCKFQEVYFDQQINWPFECPFEAESGGEYCFWHVERDRKYPRPSQLDELRGKQIFGVYLKKSVIVQGDLREAGLQWSNFEGALLIMCDLQKSNFLNSNLRGADLSGANLGRAMLEDADLQGAILSQTKLQNADLRGANLHAAYLGDSILNGTDLTGANLQDAYLEGSYFDSNSCLYNTNLIRANLYHSYIDQTKTFRNAKIFETYQLYEREINEFIADNLYNKKLLDVSQITHNGLRSPYGNKENNFDELINYGNSFDDDLFNSLLSAGLIRYGSSYSDKFIFYEDLIEWLENKENYKKISNFSDIKSKIDNLDLENCYKNFSSSKKESYYERAYEVYNKLYNFHSANGNYLLKKHIHYRIGETYRKLLLANGSLRNKLRAIFFDWLILKILTGYGERILNPVIISLLIIGLFTGFFYLTNGIIVTGRDTHWYDYIYMSLTTFTSLGFSNVQPNITSNTTYNSTLVGIAVSVPWPQILVMTESVLGVTMVALLIFIITYQISR
ncbi:hypothetical protein FXW07_18315 [Methanosarcina sp. DH1]|uniref:pentapeptide repeat-containing protein n=1 Tax=Methanosarcina sp. DH1 TaxID=2605695 RepID=UPI001E43D316|nr:pentapeptide repeat-containing protein [Methanosarcina sp. DH1]MCC4768499.1 hypothetical protein [Methanosarcina sp. DH1]